MNRLPLFLALAALTLAACDSNDPAPPSADDLAPATLLPLDIGNRWITDFVRTDADGNVTEQTADTLTVVRDTVLAGETWFRIEGTLGSASIPDGWYANREDGVWKWNDLENDEAYLIYQFPADEGDAYRIPGRAGFEVTVADADFPVETSQGTFSGILYEWDTEEAYGFPVSEGAGRFDRVMIPGRGFGFIGCSYLSSRGDPNGLVVSQRLDWDVVAFETAP
ncbi:MAG: hypothetical protein AAGI91_12950 [Bacteroidota bacterium]